MKKEAIITFILVAVTIGLVVLGANRVYNDYLSPQALRSRPDKPIDRCHVYRTYGDKYGFDYQATIDCSDVCDNPSKSIAELRFKSDVSCGCEE